MSETTTQEQTQVITLTEAAAGEIKRLLTEEPDKTGLRMEIRGGGCSGMSYGMRFDNAQEKDHVVEAFGVKIFIDPKSAIYLKGTNLDFQGGLNGQAS